MRVIMEYSAIDFVEKPGLCDIIYDKIVPHTVCDGLRIWPGLLRMVVTVANHVGWHDYFVTLGSIFQLFDMITFDEIRGHK